MLRREYGHRKARQLYPVIGTCEYPDCIKPARDRHHIDGNTFNNDRSNVMFVCRSHHMIIDGRMDKIHIKPKQPPKECLICHRDAKPLRNGRCKACSEYKRRNGIERPYKTDGRAERKLR